MSHLHVHDWYSCGSVLSAEERYKIDKTAMAEVMAEEEEEAIDEVQNREEKREDHACNGSDKGGDVEVTRDGEEAEEESVELEAILRSCDEIQQKTAETVGADLEEGEGGQPLPFT